MTICPLEAPTALRSPSDGISRSGTQKYCVIHYYLGEGEEGEAQSLEEGHSPITQRRSNSELHQEEGFLELGVLADLGIGKKLLRISQRRALLNLSAFYRMIAS